jgi:predicted permease
LLRIYPASFREAVGEDLVETALYRWRDARRRSGVRGGLAFWCVEGMRFAVDGMLERLRSAPAMIAECGRAWRHVRRAPGDHAVAVLTLALGIAATTTIFTVADAVVFRPLPYPGSEALYLIHSRFGPTELESNSLPNLRDVEASAHTLAWLAGAHEWSPVLGRDDGEVERVRALHVTEAYLPGLGARVRLGRSFVQDDYASSAQRVVIVSDALWRRRRGGDGAFAAQTVKLENIEYAVVGVMDAAFRDPEPIEAGVPTGIWVATRAGERRFATRDHYAFRWLARLAPNATVEGVRRELTPITRRLADDHPVENRVGEHALDLVPYSVRELTVGATRGRLLLLLGAVALLLGLACANVANLFLARGVVRNSELAVRSALGATRARLVLQLFSESVATAFLAGIAGTALAAAGVRAFVALAPSGSPRLHEIQLDARVLGFVFVLTLVTAAVFGVLPAVRGSRVTAAATASRTTASRGMQRLQGGLVAIEVCLSLVLLSGSALLLNGFRQLLRVHPGFDGSDVLVVDVRPPSSANTAAAERAFYTALLEGARAEPAVARAAVGYTVPGVGAGAWTRVVVEGAAPGVAQRRTAPAVGADPGDDFFRLNPIDGDYFDVLDIALRAGRTFDAGARDGGPLELILNEAAAREFFPGIEQPIGRRLALGPAAGEPLGEVVGIVADVRQRGRAHEAEPQIYVPLAQRNMGRLSLLLELRPGARLPAAEIRRLVRDVAPAVPVDDIASLDARYEATGQQTRFLTFLLSAFAAVGLLLAGVGTYATMSHMLSRRVRELGIRIALGARAASVFNLVITRALSIAAAGVAAGLALALLLSRFLAVYVYGISSRDPFTLTAACVVIGACVVLAALVPAVRAMRVQPGDVLRAE